MLQDPTIKPPSASAQAKPDRTKAKAERDAARAQKKAERERVKAERDAMRLGILQRSFELKRQAVELTRRVPAEYSQWGHIRSSAWIKLTYALRRSIERPSTKLDVIENLISKLRDLPKWDVERCVKLLSSGE